MDIIYIHIYDIILLAMKINKNQKSKKLRVLLFFAILFILLLIGAYYTYHHYSKKTVANHPPSSTKAEFTPAPAADNNPNNARKNSNTPAATLNNNGSQTTNSNSFSVSINPVVSSSNVHIGTLVNGVTNGSCVLSASQEEKAAIQLRTSTVGANVNNYDCGIFNIPVSEFPSTGSWQLNLSVTSNGKTESVKVNINIKDI